MTPGARVQAAIELLDAIIDAAAHEGAAADTIIQRYFASRRYAGSGDRRAVRDLVYGVIRALGERPASGRAAMIGYARHTDPALLDLFDGGSRAPAPVGDEPAAEPGLAPAWLVAKFADTLGGEAPKVLQALTARAPLDLRVNTLQATRAAMLRALDGFAPTPISVVGMRSPTPRPIESTAEFQSGLVEVQDEGSQLVAAACRAAPGMAVVDLCAGAGGKTLALAAAMANAGRIIACDSDRARLAQLAPRAARAGVTIIESRLVDPGREAASLTDLAATADVVLVDAPCSGTGTWRRNPEARWRLTPERLRRLVGLQARLLDAGWALVRPGGRLVYAVCSLLADEGALQADTFAARHADARPDQGLPAPANDGRLQLDPLRQKTDGFFIAGYTKPC
jgi:16S rRNA (cytosine967-C5)-methyltransferase